MFKVLNNLPAIFVLFAGITQTAVAAQIECPTTQENGVYQFLWSEKSGCVKFQFNKRNEVVIYSPKLHFKKYIVAKVPADRSPTLNAEVPYMGFYSPKAITIEGDEYIPLHYIMRSRSGGFSGECGAGTEGYLIVVKLTDAGPRNVFTKLVYSCMKGLYYDENATRQSNGPVFLRKEFIYFDWYTHPDFEKSPIGKIHLSDGHIEYVDAVSE